MDQRRAVFGVAFNPDATRLAVVGSETGLIYDTTTGDVVHSLQGVDSFSVAWSPDGTLLATAAAFGANLFAAEGGSALRAMRGHNGLVQRVAFSRDGKTLVSAGGDRTAKLWSVDSGEAIATFRGHAAALTSAALNTDATRLLTASADQTLKVWDVRGGQSSLALGENVGGVQGIAWSRDGKRIASALTTGLIVVRDCQTGSVLHEFVHQGPIGIAFHPDGTKLATSGSDTQIRIWRITGATSISNAIWPFPRRGQEGTLSGHGNYVVSLAYSSDGRRLYSASWDGTVKAWNPDEGSESFSVKVGYHAYGVAVSPDDRSVAVISAGSLVLLDAATGRVVWQRNLAFIPHVLAFSRDGRYVVCNRADELYVHVAASGEQIAAIKIHGGLPSSICFSRDGSRLICGAQDGNVTFWDWQTGAAREALRLDAHLGGVYAIALSPDGHRLASGGTDPYLRIWDATPLRASAD
jgi:WD40 repeat protein